MGPLTVGALVLGGVVLAKLRKSSRWSYGGAPFEVDDSMGGGTVYRDPSQLLPTFADTLEVLFQRLRARGLDPELYEGLRSEERAARLQELGFSQTGSKSVHCWGAGADIVSASKGWSDDAFFDALGEEAQALGLTWGGSWTTLVDKPHVQAVPTSAQGTLRSLAYLSPEADQLVASYLA